MDTLKVSSSLGNKDEIVNILSKLDNYTTITKDGNIISTARYKNLKCIYNGTLLTIYGSIPKFIHGSNQYMVNSEEIADTIKELSCLFNTDMGKAVVRRIDYAENVIMDHEVGKYLLLLQAGANGKSFSVDNETFDVAKTNIRLSAYDKIKELKQNKVPIAPEFIGKEVLRLEIRLFKKLAGMFNVPTVTFDMVKEQWFLDRLKDIWATEILKTSIKHAYIPDIDCSTTLSFVSSLASHGIEALGGIEIVLQEIDANHSLTAGQRYRINKKLRQLNSENASSTTKVLSDELYEKVRFIASVSA